jgi:hypothetical protein
VDQTSKRYHIRRRREAPPRNPVRRKQIDKKFLQAKDYGNFKLMSAALQYVRALQLCGRRIRQPSR